MMPGYFVILLRIGLAHMVERPVRTVLTIVGVALGVAAFVSVRTANMEVLRSFENTVATVAGSASLEVVSGELGFDETLIRSVRSVPGVTSATPILESAARLTAGPHVNESLQILGIDLLDTASRQAFRIRDEESPVGDLEQLVAADGLFLGQDLAAEWALTVGSRLHVVAGSREATLQVRGLIEAGEPATTWSLLPIVRGPLRRQILSQQEPVRSDQFSRFRPETPHPESGTLAGWLYQEDRYLISEETH